MISSLINKICYLLVHPKDLVISFISHTPYWWSDEVYLKIMFRMKMGKKLNLQNPQTFSEKIQWLKLYDRKPEYTIMVDKVKAKDYVASIIGEQYIIPTLGVWDDPDKIDFDALPDKFVLKLNHNSGTGMYICKNKHKMDIDAVKEGLRKGLKEDYYIQGREWPYKDVPRRILAEKYLEPMPIVKDLVCYEWYCFKGEPKFCKVKQANSDKEWNLLEIIDSTTDATTTIIECPLNIDKHILIARRLSEGIPFSRIDLYEISNNTYFGETTSFPLSEAEGFNVDGNSEELGNYLKLQGTHFGGTICKISCDGNMLVEKPDLPDYKFFCFNGQPKYCQVITGRETEMCIDFFDKEWNHQPFHEPHEYPFAKVEIDRPQNYDEMWELASKLAKGKVFSRIDFYELNDKVYFGEITFYPTGGLGGFDPQNYDELVGRMIKLPNLGRGNS